MFFFSSRRRHTRCSRDWSSDVCSSDLQVKNMELRQTPQKDRAEEHQIDDRRNERKQKLENENVRECDPTQGPVARTKQIGRASCRESVDLGGRRIIKKKKENSGQMRMK